MRGLLIFIPRLERFHKLHSDRDADRWMATLLKSPRVVATDFGGRFFFADGSYIINGTGLICEFIVAIYTRSN